LIKRYQRLIYTIPRRFGLDNDGCADVFQRTFTLLWQHLDRIEQPRQIRAWLVTTARREAGQMARRQRKVMPLEAPNETQDEGATADLIDPAPLPEATFLQLEEQHFVRLMVESLDERCIQLLMLLFYRPHSPSYAEIAAVLRIPEGSIGPTRARCLQKLRRLLENATF
jgi:RNA polymerase sigma factor (sigma-70 family)